MRLPPALLIAPLALTLAVDALAEPSARLIYSRTPEAALCPDERALRKAVAARVGYDPFFPWAKQTVVVRIGLQHGTFAARVEIVDEDGVARGARELSSTETDCVEIFDATALAISIALDAFAPVEPPPVETATPAPAAAPAPPPPPPIEPEAPPAAAPASRNGASASRACRPSRALATALKMGVPSGSRSLRSVSSSGRTRIGRTRATRGRCPSLTTPRIVTCSCDAPCLP